VNAESSQNKLLVGYLLGELSEPEQTELEERYFADPALFDELRAVRDDLIDAYIRDELSPDLRQRFERFFRASPRRREQIQFAEALLQAVDCRPRLPVRSTTRPFTSERRFGFFTGYRQAILAAAAFVLLIAGSWFFVHLIRQRQRDEQVQVITSNGPTPEPSAPAPTGSSQSPGPSPTGSPTRASSPESKPVLATFVLTSDLVRSSTETQKLLIPKDATMVQLQLSVDGAAYRNYSAVVRTPEGAEVFRVRQLKSESTKSGHVVLISIPANLLGNGDYIIRLNGLTAENETVNAGSYYFRVEKR
jgi:hypothetical protein